MSGLSTYAARPLKEPPKAVSPFGKIRLMRHGDGPGLIALARHAFQGVPNRFNADGDLPQDRVDEFYPEWAKQCVSGRMADVVHVAEDEEDGTLLGFVAVKRVEPVSTKSGAPLFGNGLAACRPDKPGAYRGLARASVLWIHERGGIAEAQTGFDNFPAIAVYEDVGFRLRRLEYQFHLVLR
jgi:hypothetical protein